MWINANPELSGGGEGGTPSAVYWKDIQDKPTEFKPEQHTHIIADITELPEIIEELKDKYFGLQEQSKLVISDLSKKVDKVEVKGRSTNDYTTAEKDSVATIPELQKSVDKNTKGMTLAVKYKEETNEIEEVTKAATNTPLEEVAVRNSVIVKNLNEVPEDMLHEGLIAIVLD